MKEIKRLDRVIAIKSSKYITKGKIYTVLGVKGSGSLLLIATDIKKRVYISTDHFIPEWQEQQDLLDRLEDRSF